MKKKQNANKKRTRSNFKRNGSKLSYVDLRPKNSVVETTNAYQTVGYFILLSSFYLPEKNRCNNIQIPYVCIYIGFDWPNASHYHS